MEDDPYGFCAHLEKDAAQVLNTTGLVAFVKAIRERFDAAATARPGQGESFTRNPDCARRRWGGILRTLYVAQKNVEAYRELAEETGLTVADCRLSRPCLSLGAEPTMRCRGWSAGSSSQRGRRTAQWRDMTSPS
jgi:hypothetical protein